MRTSDGLIDFILPRELSFPLPTEKRGLVRDEVRMMVSSEGGRKMDHARFHDLPERLDEGDILVVNTSAMRAAALPVLLPSGKQALLHISSQVFPDEWLVEIREIAGNRTKRWNLGEKNMRLSLPGGAHLILNRPYYENRSLLNLWIANLQVEKEMNTYLLEHAQPIKYEDVDVAYPLEYYQSYFSFHPGSSEMPSAGRGFTHELVEKLILKGIGFAPILLHTGVSSLEDDEMPYPEYMEIGPVSISMINAAKRKGKRIIAVGTTSIRALESAYTSEGYLLPFQGHTDLFIDKDYKMKVVDGLLTGFHEPRASHLHMLQSLAGFDHLERAYKAALSERYYWHEFGDLHLLLA